MRYRLVPDQGGEDAAAAGEAPTYWQCMNSKAINTEVCDHEATITMLQGVSSSSDGVTVCPFGTIIGHLYLVQVIVKRSLTRLDQ